MEKIIRPCNREITCKGCEDYGICPHSYREYDSDKYKQVLNEIKEYCNKNIKENETLIERLEGTNSFRIGNAQSKIKDYKDILQIIHSEGCDKNE